ncbi:MAG: Fe-S protein radical family [Acidobacteriales bacterium]|nr:Fe-S protein radical family [Terriglobales bacterium]
MAAVSNLLSLIPGEIAPDTRLVGIARLAALGESIEEHKDVEYFTLPNKSLLNKCTARNMPFTWTINPYRGCEFACKYCYARYTHEFMEMRDGIDFERKIYAKQQSAFLLRRDLKKVKPGQDIAIGTATDPYQPAERRYQITRSIMEELAMHRGFSIGVVTKSQLVLRDIDVLQRITEHNQITIHLTITTLNTDLARKLEPRAPRPDLRLDAVRKLNENGVRAAVICAPVLPGITDSPADLEALVAAAAQAGAKYVYANPLFLKDCAAKMFMPFIEQHFPQLVTAYKQRYGRDAYVSPIYRKRIADLMNKFAHKYGLPDGEERRRSREQQPEQAEVEQLTLF